MANTYLRRFITCFLCLIFSLFVELTHANDMFSEQTLRIGFFARAFPDFSREDLEISVGLLAEEIGKQVGIQTTVTIFDDIALMRANFEQGKINFVVASTLNLANDFDNNLLADGFKLIPLGEPSENIIVLTRKNEGLDEFKALRGRRLALVDYDPIADLYIDTLALTNFKKGYQASFKKLLRERKAHQIILKLFFGQADVICVYQNYYRLAGELNPQLRSKLQIISQLDGIPQGAGLFHKNVPLTFRERVIAEAINLETHARGQQLLQLFKADKTVRSTITDLTGVKELYKNHQQLNKSR